MNSFLTALREEVRCHPAVNHPFLAKLAVTPYTKEDYRVYGLQHYPLVHMFTRYLEQLLCIAPDGNTRLWLARVLVDEYGEGSQGDDHPTLYRRFLTACGVAEHEISTTPLSRSVTRFIATHLEMTRADFLFGLGAVGPGHEWAIPHMFPPLIAGLRNAGFTELEIDYFTLHIAQDEDHGAWLEEALRRFCRTEADAAVVRAGCMASLELRYAFWSGIERRIVAWRQPHTAPGRVPDPVWRTTARLFDGAVPRPARPLLAGFRRRVAPDLASLLAA